MKTTSSRDPEISRYFLVTALILASQFRCWSEGAVYADRSSFVAACQTLVGRQAAISFDPYLYGGDYYQPGWYHGQLTVADVTFGGNILVREDSHSISGEAALNNYDMDVPLSVHFQNGALAFGADFSSGLYPYNSSNFTATINIPGGGTYTFSAAPGPGKTFFGVIESSPFSDLTFSDGGAFGIRQGTDGSPNGTYHEELVGNPFVVQVGPEPAFTGVDLGKVQAATLGHFFQNLYPHPRGSQRNTLYDFLIDMDASSGGGGVLPPVSVNWSTNNQFKLTVSAPSGQKFCVHVPAGQAVGFSGVLEWDSNGGEFSPAGLVEASFAGLEGTPPDFSNGSSMLSRSYGFFGFTNLNGTTVTNDFAFTSITLVGTAVPQYIGLGTENYTATQNSYLALYYETTDTSDPGRFVYLVSANPLPVIQFVTMSPDTGALLRVQGHAGRTNVVECSSDLVQWTPISTNVMPVAVYPASPAVDVTDATGVNLVQRFYRACELP